MAQAQSTSDMRQCVTCQHFSLRTSPVARNGFGQCAHDRVWVLKSAVYPRDCSHHEPAEQDVASKRREWLGRRP